MMGWNVSSIQKSALTQEGLRLSISERSENSPVFKIRFQMKKGNRQEIGGVSVPGLKIIKRDVDIRKDSTLLGHGPGENGLETS